MGSTFPLTGITYVVFTQNPKSVWYRNTFLVTDMIFSGVLCFGKRVYILRVKRCVVVENNARKLFWVHNGLENKDINLNKESQV